MPERHSSGESSSSSSSSSESSSSSSGDSSYHYNNYNNYNNGPQSEESRELSRIWVVVVIIGVAIFLIGSAISKANDANQKAKDDTAQTATTQAITVKDLAEMHAALDSRLPLWKQVTDKTVHRVSYSDAGFSADSNTKEVDYGYCDDGKFYVYVLENSQPGGTTFADSEGYAYTPGTSPKFCVPKGWYVYETDDVGKDWFFVTIQTATYSQPALPTFMNPYQTPTATPDESSEF